MRRPYTIVVGITVLASLVVALLPSTASADTTPAEEALRSSLSTYVQNLQSALDAASTNPLTHDAMASKVADYQAALDVATQQVAALTPDALDAMQGLLGQNSAWQDQPKVVAQNLSGTAVKAPSIATPGFLSDCTSDLEHGDPRGLFWGYFAAAQVADIANAVASGMPDGADFVAADIIAGAAFGVANGIAIGLQAALALALDCAQAVNNAALQATYPMDNGSFTRASSQISVDQLKVLSQGIQTTLDSIQSDINTITSKLSDAINSFGNAQGTANTIQTIAMDLQSRTDVLLSSVGTAADSATDPGVGGPPPTGTANGLANTINAREDTTLSNTAAFQTLSVRMEIERTLAQNGPVVTLFALPASQGGYLETVQSVVTTTVTNELAAGQSVGSAQANLAAGNTALANHQYQTAYLDFAAAYLQAVN
jgi:hypothetical protein